MEWLVMSFALLGSAAGSYLGLRATYWRASRQALDRVHELLENQDRIENAHGHFAPPPDHDEFARFHLQRRRYHQHQLDAFAGRTTPEAQSQ